MKRFFNVIPGDGSCCLLLYGDIGDSCGSVSSGQIARELFEAESQYERIDVRINSNGGEVYAGIAIFNALRNSKADIHIYVDGIAASMASAIALCGKPVEMSKYARLMLHSVSGGCFGTKEDMLQCAEEIESLERTLCEMYASRLGCSAEEVRDRYFDGKDHWLTASEALELGFVDGIYDVAPVSMDSTPEQIYTIFNNRLYEPQNREAMNLEELRQRPRFKDCSTDADVLASIIELEERASVADSLEHENAVLRDRVKSYEDAAEAVAKAERESLLDAAEQDGRIDASTRGIYENMLKEHPEDGKKLLASLQPKQRVLDDIDNGSERKTPWAKRQEEIRKNFGR